MRNQLAAAALVASLLAANAYAYLPSLSFVGAISSGVGAVTPALPGTTVAGDGMFMFIETNSEEIPTAAGWTQLAEQHSAATGANGSRLTVLYRVATSSTDARTTNDPGDHIIARIIKVNSVQWDHLTPTVIAGGARDVGGTSISIPGGSMVKQSCLIFAAFTDNVGGIPDTAQCTSWTNSGLVAVAEKIDNRRSDGSGGTLCVVAGHRGPIGPYGSTTAVQVSATGVGGLISFAVCAPRRNHGIM